MCGTLYGGVALICCSLWVCGFDLLPPCYREGDGTAYSFVMDALLSYLKNLASKNPAPFHNVQILKYEV